MKEYRITVRLTAELRQRLKNAAHRSGTRESDIVREAVERQLTTEDEALDVHERVRRAGLIGVVRGASRDLSTNRMHFEGFGGS